MPRRSPTVFQLGPAALRHHWRARRQLSAGDATEDADLIFERSPASEAALLEALQSIHACWISDERDPATGQERLVPVSPSYVRGEHLMMLTTDLGFLDLYDYIPGFPDEPVADVFADSIEVDNLRFVSLRWLRKLKQAAGRHKDLDDLEHLPSS
jgi:hypothetical protein